MSKKEKIYKIDGMQYYCVILSEEDINGKGRIKFRKVKQRTAKKKFNVPLIIIHQIKMQTFVHVLKRISGLF